MKITTTIAALLFCTAALASSPHKYRLIWQDNFDGNTYDNLSWSKIPRGNADWKRHMSDADLLYAVRDGRLVLRGAVNTHRDADTARYVTGGLYTKHKRTIRHGKVEVRAKFGSAQGAWPAIWMLPDAEIKWPEGGEIDIMEHLNHDTIAYQTIHTYYTHVLKKDQNPPPRLYPAHRPRRLQHLCRRDTARLHHPVGQRKDIAGLPQDRDHRQGPVPIRHTLLPARRHAD